MKAKKGQEKVESMAIKLFRFNYARDLIYGIKFYRILNIIVIFIYINHNIGSLK